MTESYSAEIFYAIIILAFISLLAIALLSIWETFPKKNKPRNGRKYISFREQVINCTKNGIRKDITNVYGSFPATILLCTKYNEICCNKVCEEERGVTALRKKYNRGVTYDEV